MKQRKITAIVLAVCMLLSIGITAFAEGKLQVGVGEVLKEVDIIGKAPAEGQEVLMFCDFETIDEKGRPVYAKTKSDEYEKWFSVVRDKERGSNVLRIADTENNNHPWMRWEVPIVSGAKYQLAGLVKRPNDGAAGFPQVFVECFDKNDGYLCSAGNGQLTHVKKGEGWGEFSVEFTIPNVEAVKGGVYVRLHSDGEVLYDDLVFYMTENSSRFSAVDSGFLYYRDETEGKATATLNTVSYSDYEGKQIVMKVMDGEAVLEETSIPAAETVEWRFSTLKLTEVEKAYTLRAEYVDETGEVLEQKDKEIVIYNRPKNLTKDGYVLDENGEIFYPYVAYSGFPSQYEDMKALGLTVATSVYHSGQMDLVKDVLDKAKKAGLKILIPLYAGMYPPAYGDNVKKTIECIKQIKDHPALLGYMIMDEPFGHIAKVGGVEQMYQILQDSYKLIREHDKEHLIYIVETTMKYVEYAGNCCDLLAVDPYIALEFDNIGSRVSRDVSAAIEEIEGRKPVISIVQAWEWNGGKGDIYYLPTANDVRSFLYQSLIVGAKGIGYFRIRDISNKDNPTIWDYPLIEGVEYFRDNEWEDAQKAFITGEYPTFAQNTDPDSPYWYKIFVKDKELYAVVINREVKENEIEIPLTSIDGSVSIDHFKAEPDPISGMEIISGRGTLKATLSKAQVVRFKLTIREDLSGLTTSRYRDVYDYGWAKGAIDRMYQAGVTNEKGVSTFAPGEQITRGDFAMFLIKTLGLTAKATDNFADVNPYAEYAEAISIGKALGILKGTDGVNFNPETPISRQDFMVICARGMRLMKALEAGDASQFADAATISDYAVADIAAMVKANIVGGYEDGTVRPLGNATRAEAAVIMDRITSWNK